MKKIRKKKSKEILKESVDSKSGSEIQEILKQFERKREKEKKPKKENKAEKEAKTKTKKSKGKKPDIAYKSQSRLDYERAFYSQANSLDYKKIFDYMGREYKDPYKMFIESMKERNGLGSNDILTEEELEKIIKREQISLMLRNSIDRADVEEREKYKYWKDLHRLWNMIKIDMQRVANAIPGIFYF